MYQVKVAISTDNFSDRKKIYVGRILPDGYDILYSDKVVATKEGEVFDPSLTLNQEEFQALVDAIHKDYKPSEGKFVEGKLEGTERHLQDLRQILKLN